MKYLLNRFGYEDQRKLNLMFNMKGKRANQVLLDAVRHYFHHTFDGKTVDEVLDRVLSGVAEDGPKVQKRLC